MVRSLVAFCLSTATLAHAGLSGQLSATGQAVALEAGTPNGGTQRAFSVMLQENLGLQYTGSPFGPSVALLGAGLQASNTNGWGADGAALAGRTATLDFSVGLLPRRSIPLRLYVRGTVTDAGPQSLPTFGGRESLAYGANLNFEPGAWLPGVRADYEEQRFTGLGATQPLGDLRRVATLGLSRSLGREQLYLGGRFDQEQRALTGSWRGVSVNGHWMSAEHQTTVFGSYVDRQVKLVLPGAPTATTERQLRVDHVQRWSPQLSSELHGRLGDARFAGGDGALGGAGLGLLWRPLVGHDLVVSAAGDVGFTQTSGAGAGNSVGGLVRAGYSRALGPVRAGLFGGAGTQFCGCSSSSTGLLSSVDVGATVGTLGFERVEARAEYRLAAVDAPAGRGGKRTEHHVLGSARVRVTTRAELTLNAGYDDGFRDYIDVTSGGVAALHEQAFFGGGSFTLGLFRGTLTLDARHARGGALLPQGAFVDGPPPTARAVTSLGLFALQPVGPSVDVSLGAQAAWTVLDAGAPLSTVGGTAGVNVRLGRIAAQLQYQFNRADTQGLVSNQHFLRLSVSRPFELF